MKRFLSVVLFFGASAVSSAASLQSAHRLYFQGESEKAFTAYQEVLASTPSVEAALNAAQIAVELGRHDEGIAILTKAVKKNPDSYFLKRDLAWLLLGEEQKSKAEPLFEAIASTEDVVSLLARGIFLLGKKEYGLAASIFQKMVERWPRLAIGYYFLGENEERRGAYEASAGFYERALKEDSHFIEARPRLGAVFEKRSMADDAWRQYARISYADPGNIQALVGMARLVSKITKKPEEIVPPKVIEKHRDISLIADAENLPRLRIGIGTSQSGQPTSKKFVRFRTSSAFVILNSSTSFELAQGRAIETYEVRITTNNRFLIVSDSQGNEILKSTASILVHQAAPRSSTILNALTYAPGTTWGGMADKELRGDIEVILDRKKKRIVLVNRVNIEEYVYGVLAAEMPVHWPMEALKSQAVIVRTLALYRKRNLRLHRKDGYDLCDEQHCQVYTGVGVESDKVKTAVDQTRGLALTYQGDPIHAVFSSNCGGISQSGSQAGWGDVAYWKSVDDTREGLRPVSPWALSEWLRNYPDLYCQASSCVWMPEYRWWRVVPAEEMGRRVARKRHIGRIRQIRILKRNATGRVRKVQIVGTNGVLVLTKEHEIRRYLGMGLLRSDMFTIHRLVENGKTKTFIIAGGGWGHGVGFCQSGAAGRAEDGKPFEEILGHYFPGTKVKKVE
jgi:SpoIID/LytB domain protein